MPDNLNEKYHGKDGHKKINKDDEFDKHPPISHKGTFVRKDGHRNKKQKLSWWRGLSLGD